MGQDARTESLQAKHKEIEFIIFEEEKRPLPDYAAVQELKRKKLKIKDELIRMTGRLSRNKVQPQSQSSGAKTREDSPAACERVGSPKV